MKAQKQPDITAFFIRHPSYRLLKHPEENFTLISPRTTGVSNRAYREMTELLWLFAENEAAYGITNPKILRNFDALYSTPSIRGVQGCMALSPGLQIRQKPQLPNPATRYQEKLDFYNSLGWSPEDALLIPAIIKEEIEYEKIAYAADISILDGLFELLEIPPKWTGANQAVFREEMNRSKFNPQRIDYLRQALTKTMLTPSDEPKRFIFMVHGSTMAFLRKYGQYILGNTWPEAEIARKTFGEIKYENLRLEDLSYHGSGLVFRYTHSGECLSQDHLSSRKIIEETSYDPRKRLIFKEEYTLHN